MYTGDAPVGKREVVDYVPVGVFVATGCVAVEC
jgi:hypothetical protein